MPPRPMSSRAGAAAAAAVPRRGARRASLPRRRSPRASPAWSVQRHPVGPGHRERQPDPDDLRPEPVLHERHGRDRHRDRRTRTTPSSSGAAGRATARRPGPACSRSSRTRSWAPTSPPASPCTSPSRARGASRAHRPGSTPAPRSATACSPSAPMRPSRRRRRAAGHSRAGREARRPPTSASSRPVTGPEAARSSSEPRRVPTRSRSRPRSPSSTRLRRRLRSRARSPTPNANGWNNTDVTSTWGCTDTGSGPQSPTVTQTISTEGAGQQVTGTCFDVAGELGDGRRGHGQHRQDRADGQPDPEPEPRCERLVQPPVHRHLGRHRRPLRDRQLLGRPRLQRYRHFERHPRRQLHRQGREQRRRQLLLRVRRDGSDDRLRQPHSGKRQRLEQRRRDGDLVVHRLRVRCRVRRPFSRQSAAKGRIESATGTCTDNAGNVSHDTVTGIRIDKTPPDVSATPSREADGNGWYNHALTVTWSATDALSGGVTCDAPQTYNGPDIASQTLTGSCTDAAGNSADASFTVKYDSTAPAIAFEGRTAPNGNGWNDTAVTLTWDCTDGGSGAAAPRSPTRSSATAPGSRPPAPAPTWPETASATPRTGSTSTRPGPVVTPHPSAPANANGWHAAPFTVTWDGSDAGSGIASCSSDSSISAETANATAQGTCTDLAGNSTTADYGYKLDTEAPTLLQSDISAQGTNAGLLVSSYPDVSATDNFGAPHDRLHAVCAAYLPRGPVDSRLVHGHGRRRQPGDGLVPRPDRRNSRPHGRRNPLGSVHEGRRRRHTDDRRPELGPRRYLGHGYPRRHPPAGPHRVGDRGLRLVVRARDRDLYAQRLVGSGRHLSCDHGDGVAVGDAAADSVTTPSPSPAAPSPSARPATTPPATGSWSSARRLRPGSRRPPCPFLPRLRRL